MSSCDQEADALVRCAASPGSDGCAAAFLAMRECNRGKAELRFDSGKLEVTNKAEYAVTSCPAPPSRSNLAMAADAYAKKLHIGDGVSALRF
ncbi:unnamed protein product [Amoebophrya sp. A120]|nr:unnamed protein product [Amoebophrya sp. A120]|eukprot:GSA120T00020265001.1